MGTAAKGIGNDVFIADLKRVHSIAGRISKRIYLKHGLYSERQVRNTFGSFNAAVVKAGLWGQTPVVITQAEPKPIPEGTNEFVGDKWNAVQKSNTQITSLEELITFFKVDSSVWDVERWKCNTWAMAGFPKTTGESKHWKRDSTEPIITPIYQVSATFVKNKAVVDARQIIAELKEEAKTFARNPLPVVRSSEESENVLELMIPDLHAAKLCWGKETGAADYDTRIALSTYRRALADLVQQARGHKVDRILLGVGNDLLQADNIQGTTYSGTKVDTDSRYKKSYKLVRVMLSEVIEELRQIAPVEVKIVPGNHDTLSSFTLGDSLECVFDKYTDVTVDNEPSIHKTFEWGDVFLIMTHGHQGKQADYGIWLASTYRKQFGRTKFNEIHVGHKHKTALDEKFGIRVRTFSSLTPPDAWHAENIFVNNLRVAEGLVWNKKKGLVAQFYYTEVD